MVSSPLGWMSRVSERTSSSQKKANCFRPSGLQDLVAVLGFTFLHLLVGMWYMVVLGDLVIYRFCEIIVFRGLNTIFCHWCISSPFQDPREDEMRS